MTTLAPPAVAAPTSVPGVLPLPENGARLGPVTRRALGRSFLVLGIVVAAGGALTLLGDGPWDRLGAGIAVPGGGFFAVGAWPAGVLVAASIVPALLLWWGLGFVLAVPGVWLLGAFLAMAVGSGDVGITSLGTSVAGGALLVLALMAAGRVARQRSARLGREIQDEIREADKAVPAASRAPLRRDEEASAEDLAALRYAVDLALQPPDRWDGFHVVDQIREAAVRYQLNMLGYAVSSFQHVHTPAFTGYVAEAQRQAIEKMLQPLAWRYWRWENLWGNLAWGPDPCARDNVMLSGYWGAQIGLYAALNEDPRYDRPGSLTFADHTGSYPWDFRRLAGAMRSNIDASAYGLFPCEPHWIYPYCNAFGLTTIAFDDAAHGDRDGAGVERLARYRELFEREFVRPDGRLVTIRNRTGLSLPGTIAGGDALIAYWTHATMPDIAERTWWLLRRRIPKHGPPLPRPGLIDRVDIGNYRVGNGVAGRVALDLCAREVGDHEVSTAIQEFLDEHAPAEQQGGVYRRPDVSVYGNLVALHARFTREGTLREMLTRAAEPTSGPRLCDVAYPDVLVARAVSRDDGLDLVLRRGAATHGIRERLGLERLQPGRTYALDGCTEQDVVADPAGRAEVQVDLIDRCEVRVRPI